MRKILLIEPGYKNKYPPLGLMKLSTYHKALGDEVHFIKGKDLKYKQVKWDRIYVSTIFTFYWKVTVDTINYYKHSVHDQKDFFIGGVMATVMADRIEAATGIKPWKGLIDKPRMLDPDNDLIVDEMVPDYDILEEIDFQYPPAESYIAYTTRGCVRKCDFCAVPEIEPIFKHGISLKDKIEKIDMLFGPKQNLILMDNNILGSHTFSDIIDEIKAVGFERGAKFKVPNYYEFYMKRLKQNHLDKTAYKRLRQIWLDTVKKTNNKRFAKDIELIASILSEYDSSIEQIEEEKKFNPELSLFFINADPLFSPIADKHRNKSSRNRYVDFNQGVDARLLTEEKMKKLSEINIKPLRIAFDHLALKDVYIEKIRLAARYGITDLSNYVLYNYTDKPEDLYERLRINIELNEELGIKIYSFPMKYSPTEDVDRKHIGRYWTPKYIRSMQIILNAVHGAVMPGKNFFEVAFGKNVDEFMQILMLPDDYLLNRRINTQNGSIEQWKTDMKAMRQKDNELFIKSLQVIHQREYVDYANHDLGPSYFSENPILAHYVK